MSLSAVSLGQGTLGAETLGQLARGRYTGTLTWELVGKRVKLLFRDGRPEAGQNADGQAASQRAAVVALLRGVALAHAGQLTLTPEAPAAQASLGIDTLGEVLLAVVTVLPPAAAQGYLAPRAAASAVATPLFARLSAAILSVGGPRLEALGGGTLAQLAGGEPARQRAVVALLLLGGLKADAPVAAPAGSLAQEVDAAHAAMATQDHYAFLGIATDAPVEVVRRAYFDQAKRWHTDRLVGGALDESRRAKAADLFRRAEEANRVLSNADERKAYNWVCERTALGLPSDPRVILEAETLFRRGETLVRRGQAGPAETVLRQAVALNKGEPEFWAYLGFAIYGAKGATGVVEARECLHKALAARGTLDVVHEFLGRIAHGEGELEAAKSHLLRALELNDKNTAAERELRLIEMRREGKKGAEDRGFLAKLLKRS